MTPVATLRLGAIAGLVLGWELLARSGLVLSVFLAPPSQVLTVLPDVLATSVEALSTTFGMTLVVVAVSLLVGVTTGVLLGNILYLYDVFHVYLIVLYSMPKIIFFPLLILWLGAGLAPILVFSVLFATTPVIVLTVGAVRDLNPAYIRVARAFGAVGHQIYFKVILPSILPSLINTIRVGVVMSLAGVLIGDIYLDFNGVGHLLLAYSMALRSTELYAVILIVVAIVSLLLGAIAILDRRVTRSGALRLPSY